jgi:hypothetical protein
MPLILIIHNLALFDKLTWKVITSEVQFSEFGPSSFVGNREVEDFRPNKPSFLLGLELLATG